MLIKCYFETNISIFPPEFRKMWAEFEWENKVSVQSNITDMNQYLDHILNSTNMRCLTPKQVNTLNRV